MRRAWEGVEEIASLGTAVLVDRRIFAKNCQFTAANSYIDMNISRSLFAKYYTDLEEYLRWRYAVRGQKKSSPPSHQPNHGHLVEPT